VERAKIISSKREMWLGLALRVNSLDGIPSEQHRISLVPNDASSDTFLWNRSRLTVIVKPKWVS
jgi:hypothetical protein